MEYHMPNIKIDARVCSYSGANVRILAVLNTDTQQLAVGNILPFEANAKGDDNTVIVTDSPNRIPIYQLAFFEKEHLKTATHAYLELSKSNLLLLKDRACDPSNIVQTRKIDEKGTDLEFDTSTLNNAHVAVLLIAWAAQKTVLSHQISTAFSADDRDDVDNDDYSTPFLI
jgi:hypothetical protein